MIYIFWESTTTDKGTGGKAPPHNGAGRQHHPQGVENHTTQQKMVRKRHPNSKKETTAPHPNQGDHRNRWKAGPPAEGQGEKHHPTMGHEGKHLPPPTEKERGGKAPPHKTEEERKQHHSQIRGMKAEPPQRSRGEKQVHMVRNGKHNSKEKCESSSTPERRRGDSSTTLL